MLNSNERIIKHKVGLLNLAEELGHVSKARLMVGLHVLKHKFTLSDEEVCARRGYDPYFRSFCGEVYFQASVSH
jgi:hypothetical protein